MDDRFVLVGRRPSPPPPPQPRRPYRPPALPALALGILLLGCLFCEAFLPHDPTLVDLSACGLPPCRRFCFGTDAMGRDIFSMLWYGGRLSLLTGAGAAAVSTALALLLGGISGWGPRWLDGLLMRLTECAMSVPQLLAVLLLQALIGTKDPPRLALVMGLTGWMGLAKVVRTEVRQLKNRDYVLAARCMGGSFFHILKKHLTPNLLPSMMFMVVMNLRGAIAAEAALSFLGLGLPLEVISWGSLLSLSQRAVLGGWWWAVLFPGLFLVTALLCVTALGNDLRIHMGGR